MYSGRLRKRLPKIVSIGTGSNMKSADPASSGYKVEKMTNADGSPKYGRVLNDTCALTIARRGLMRYLLHQAENFYKHQTDTKMDHFENIFRMDPEAHLLILRDGIDIVLYLSGMVSKPT